MRELFDQVVSLVRKAWLYRRLALPVAFVICLVGWAVVLALPDQYQARTRVYVDSQNTLGLMVKGLAIDADAIEAELVRVSRSSLLSGPNLERVIRETDLDINLKTPTDREKLVRKLRESIVVRAEGTSRDRGAQENIVTIEYTHEDPRLAATIVSTLLDIFTETVLGGNRRNSDESTRFFDRQIQDFEQKMNQADEQLRAFQQRTAGMAQGAAVLNALQSQRNAISDQQLTVRGIELIRGELERQLRTLTAGSVDPSANPEEAARQQKALAGMQLLEQLQQLTNTLRNMRLTYTDSHPDVVAIKNTIAELQAQAEASGARELLNSSPDATPISAGASETVKAELRVSLARVEADYVSAKSRLEEYETRLERLQQSASAAPELDAERQRLTRAYELARERHDQLVARQEAARLAREVDLSTDQSLFQILEPPRAPTLPVGPNRTVLVSFVLLAGIGAGVGIGVVMSQMRPTYGDVQEVSRNLDVLVLGRVGLVRTAQEYRRHLLSYFAYAGAGTALMLCYAYVLLVHTMDVNLVSLMAIWT